MDYHIFAMNNEDKFSQSTVGMNTLYDGPSSFHVESNGHNVDWS